jgi:hypothetical protein
LNRQSHSGKVFQRVASTPADLLESRSAGEHGLSSVEEKHDGGLSREQTVPADSSDRRIIDAIRHQGRSVFPAMVGLVIYVAVGAIQIASRGKLDNKRIESRVSGHFYNPPCILATVSFLLILATAETSRGELPA